MDFEISPQGGRSRPEGGRQVPSEVNLVGICTGFRMVGTNSERPAAGTTEGTSHDPKTAERPTLSPVCRLWSRV